MQQMKRIARNGQTSRRRHAGAAATLYAGAAATL